MQIVRLLTRKRYVPKWDSFAIYWIGILLRNYKTDFASNSVLHASVEFIPEYYLEAKKHFDDFMKIEFDHLCACKNILTKEVVFDFHSFTERGYA